MPRPRGGDWLEDEIQAWRRSGVGVVVSLLTPDEIADYDAYDESRADFSRWKGIYETLVRRKDAYRKQLEGRELTEVLRVQPAY